MKKTATRKKKAAALKPLPLSRAKTAYGLVMDAAKAVAEEPRRADMRMFISGPGDGPRSGKPACGTVGCFAGWIDILSGRATQNGALAEDYDSYDDYTATMILGRDLNYCTVGDEQRYVFNSGGGDACEHTDPRTKAHANAVVARIKHFARVNEEQLKARKLIRHKGALYGPDEPLVD